MLHIVQFLSKSSNGCHIYCCSWSCPLTQQVGIKLHAYTVKNGVLQVITVIPLGYSDFVAIEAINSCGYKFSMAT